MSRFVLEKFTPEEKVAFYSRLVGLPKNCSIYGDTRAIDNAEDMFLVWSSTSGRGLGTFYTYLFWYRSRPIWVNLECGGLSPLTWSGWEGLGEEEIALINNFIKEAYCVLIAAELARQGKTNRDIDIAVEVHRYLTPEERIQAEARLKILAQRMKAAINNLENLPSYQPTKVVKKMLRDLLCGAALIVATAVAIGVIQAFH